MEKALTSTVSFFSSEMVPVIVRWIITDVIEPRTKASCRFMEPGVRRGRMVRGRDEKVLLRIN